MLDVALNGSQETRMSTRYLGNYTFYLFWISLSFFTESISSGVVTLDSIEIFTTHELLNAEPSVYFKCKGENKTELPDVVKSHVLYAFKGQESWQPLTELPEKKCKRCGFYEKDRWKSDDVYQEWEFCPSDFKPPNGNYLLFKEKQLNATFSCPQCLATANATASNSDPSTHGGVKGKRMHAILVILITCVVTAVLFAGVVVAYKYWQKRRRQQEQARFLKLFEDGDELEDQIGFATEI